MKPLRLIAGWLLAVAVPGALAAPGAGTPTACLFEDTIQIGAATTRATWWLLRDGDRIETRSADGARGELWLREDAGALKHSKLDHRERVAIDYSEAELALLGAKPEALWYWEWPLPERRTLAIDGGSIERQLERCQPPAEVGLAFTDEEALVRYRRVDHIDIGDVHGDAQMRRVLGALGHMDEH